MGGENLSVHRIQCEGNKRFIVVTTVTDRRRLAEISNVVYTRHQSPSQAYHHFAVYNLDSPYDKARMKLCF
jgi:hypothetical protein